MEDLFGGRAYNNCIGVAGELACTLGGLWIIQNALGMCQDGYIYFEVDVLLKGVWTF
jgi:hypothetical protein